MPNFLARVRTTWPARRKAEEARAQQAVNIRRTGVPRERCVPWGGSARWQPATPTPLDRPWGELYQDSYDALEAYRTNPLARQIVRVQTAFVVGAGLSVHSPLPEVEQWLARVWRLNHMDQRLWQWCDALTLDGELFPVVHLDPGTGLAHIRARPRLSIAEIEVDPDDYELELRYHDIDAQRWWNSPANGPQSPTRGENGATSGQRSPRPVMLHFAVNRPIGAIRGEGDLAPLLPWLRRYHDWLLDRVKLNKYRSRFYWWVKLTGASDEEIDEARERYATPPGDGSIIVTSEREEWQPITPKIEAGDARDDGRAIEKMVAAGSGQPLHWLGEVESATRSTAKDAGAPAFRLLTGRQQFFTELVHRCLAQAAYGAHLSGHLLATWPADGDLRLTTQTNDLTREDNLALAQATEHIVHALDLAAQHGWIDDATASLWLSRFAGEKETAKPRKS